MPASSLAFLSVVKVQWNLPKPVAAMEDGIIIVGFIDPFIKDGGPVPELLIDDDCGIKSVEDVWEIFDGPKLP